jgi:hypothetical protein
VKTLLLCGVWARNSWYCSAINFHSQSRKVGLSLPRRVQIFIEVEGTLMMEVKAKNASSLRCFMSLRNESSIDATENVFDSSSCYRARWDGTYLKQVKWKSWRICVQSMSWSPPKSEVLDSNSFICETELSHLYLWGGTTKNGIVSEAEILPNGPNFVCSSHTPRVLSITDGLVSYSGSFYTYSIC